MSTLRQGTRWQEHQALQVAILRCRCWRSRQGTAWRLRSRGRGSGSRSGLPQRTRASGGVGRLSTSWRLPMLGNLAACSTPLPAVRAGSSLVWQPPQSIRGQRLDATRLALRRLLEGSGVMPLCLSSSPGQSGRQHQQVVSQPSPQTSRQMQCSSLQLRGQRGSSYGSSLQLRRQLSGGK